MKTMYKWILYAGLLINGAAYAQTNEVCQTWDQVRGKNVEMGFSEKRVEDLMALGKKQGLNAEELDQLLKTVYTAKEEQLPAEQVCIKIEEGLAKKVPVERIEKAAQTRLNFLRQADELVESIRNKATGEHRGQGGGGKGEGKGAQKGNGKGRGQGLGKNGESNKSHGNAAGPPFLVENVCMALESGVPLPILQEVFDHSDRARMGRITPVVDAAEALQLAGLEPQQYQRVLIDFVKKDLKRKEIEKKVTRIEKQLATGTPFDEVYNTLWSESTTTAQTTE